MSQPRHADATPLAATPPPRRSERKHRDLSTLAAAAPLPQAISRPRRRSPPTAKPQQNALPVSLHETRRRACFDASRQRHKRTQPGRRWLGRGGLGNKSVVPACAGATPR